MKINFKNLNLVLFCFILLAFHYQVKCQQASIQNKNITYYSVNQVIKGQNTNTNQGKGFHIIQLDQLQKKYLFVELKTSGESKFIDISQYIYRGTQKTPFKVCKKQEVDSCFISQQNLQKNSQLLVIVDCGTTCQYQLRLYWSNLEHIQAGDKIKFMFAEQKSQLYHLQLDKMPEFAELVLILKPQTRREMFDNVKIYGKYGTNSTPSANDYDFKSMHLWQDSQGIYLYTKQMKQKNINILVTGQSNTVYVLTCQAVSNKTHDMYPGEVLNQYLQPQQQATYHVNFTSSKGKLQFEEYVFKVSAFNGNLTVGLFIDADYTKAYSIPPYEYMSDAQFLFRRQQLSSSLPSGIYVKIKSFDRVSTFVLQFTGRSKQNAIQMKQNIYQITQIQYQHPKLIYFDSHYFMNQETYQQNYSFTIHLINVKGQHGLTFRVCKVDFQKCLNKDTFQNYSQVLTPKRYDEIGTKKTFKIQVSKQMLSNINKVQQKITILMVVSNIQNSMSIAALEFYADSKYQILRQSRPIQSKLKKFQNKLYKFTNVDKLIKEVRIHINRISGLVNVVSLRDNPQVNNNGKKMTSNVMSFTDQLMEKPIFLIVFAEQQSILSIDVQLIHQNADNIAYITMQQDVQFKIKIPPLQKEFLQVHPVYDSIYFDYKSTGLVYVCQFQNNICKTQIPDMGTQGSIQVQNFTSRNQIIMIQNPSDSKTISFSAIYHSADYDHCQHRKTGVIYTQVIQNRQCLSFPLTKIEQIQVMSTRMDLGNLHTAFLLCNNVIDLEHQNRGDKWVISKKTMQKHCTNKDHNVLLVVLSGQKLPQQNNQKIDFDDHNKKTPTKQNKAKVKISVQYTDDGAIVIPDGVPYFASKVAKQEALQVFYYQVLNYVNTSIILSNKIGNAYFTAKIMKTVDRHRALTTNTFDFSSNSSNYYMNPVVKVSSDFLQHNPTCITQCSLIIKIFSKEKIGARNDFEVQVTQNYFVLQQHKMKQDFLVKDAITYYSFFNKEHENSLLIQTSDNNKKCTKIILSDRQYPSDTNNLQIEYGNQMIYEKAENKTYFIAIQALENCGYSISISCTQTHITLLQRGKAGYLKLKEGQVKFFMFHRLTSNPFKILSNHVYGEIEFYLNKTTTDSIAVLVKQKSIDYQKFKIKGQFKNRLVIDQQQQLCQNCYYILACYAKKSTDTTIYLGDRDSFLSISQKKSINDLLKHTGDSLKGYYYQVQDTLLKVKVHSGKLSVKVNYFQQKFQKEFTKVDDMYEESFKLKRKEDDWTPAVIQLTALQQQTLYSIRFQTKASSQFSNAVDSVDVTPGEPTYIYMTSQRTYCLQGYLRDNLEKIMITSDKLYEHGLQSMKVQAVVNGTQVQFIKQHIRNILTIKIPLNDTFLKQAQKYSICLSSQEQSFSATAFQTEGVNILPQDVQSVAYGSMTYAIRPSGNFLIDIFECTGKANITYSQTLKNLSQAKKNTLDILGMPNQNHAFKISQYQTTFIKIEGELSTIRWISIDQKNETGLGYLQYKVGAMKYTASDHYIHFEWEGLKSNGEVHTKVKQINYTIYISNQTQTLQNAQNCDYYKSLEKILTYKVAGNKENVGLNSFSKFQVKKSDLLEKYLSIENLFVGIVAQVDIQPLENNELEHYRFFYPKQQIPREVFAANTQYLNKVLYIGIIIAIVIAFLIFSWICTKKIIPLLARLKNRMLVEQQDKGRQQQQLGDAPLPSTQRKTIQAKIDTQEKMNDEIEKK